MRNYLLLTLSLAAFAQSPKPAMPPLPDSVRVEANISYSQYPETVLDVFQPAAPGSSAKRPGVVVIHGGGWRNGAKESVVERLVLPFVEKGFVAANVEYRLSAVATAPAAIADALTATEYFIDNAKRWNVDPKRIVVTGDSAGGHLALMVGMAPKRLKLGPDPDVAAVINFYGITDVLDQVQGPNMREYAVQWVPDEPGRVELASRVSPITHVRKDVPAILTIHGNADQTVPYEHGVNLTRELRDAGADAEMISVPGGKHGFTPEETAKLWPQIFDFLARRGIQK